MQGPGGQVQAQDLLAERSLVSNLKVMMPLDKNSFDGVTGESHWNEFKRLGGEMQLWHVCVLKRKVSQKGVSVRRPKGVHRASWYVRNRRQSSRHRPG